MTQPMPSSELPQDPAFLVLEDGRVRIGTPYGARGQAIGEIVFNTGMTGYQETLTDPSYHRQIVVMTAPHIGNTGVNDDDVESNRMWVAGFVVRDPARRASSWRAQRELADELAAQGVVAIAGLDTRALTRHIRELGAMRAGIFSGPAIPYRQGNGPDVAAMIEIVQAAAPMKGAELATEVSTTKEYTVEPAGPARATVVALDLGMKSMTPRRFAERGVRTIVLPATATTADILAHRPDGVFASNGPGDPDTAVEPVEVIRDILDRRIPFFGICFGNQLLGRALGFGTYKLGYGHRGINQPVLDVTTGKVEVTAHNHGFAVDMPLENVVTAPFDNGRFGRVMVSHIGLNDRVVEGIMCLDRPAFAVQYHPEAAAGPHDATYLFDRFIDLMLDTANEQDS